MRLSVFVSAVFAASLFAGGAMADRPGEDSGRTTRLPPVKELRVREVKEMKAAQPHDTTRTTRVRDNTVTERMRSRGDMVDRYGAGPSAAAAAKTGNNTASIKSQRNAEKALERLNARKNQVINCAPGDETCGQSSRAATAGARAATQNHTSAADQKSKDDRARAEIQKKIDELRAARMKEKIMQMMCEKKASTCVANL
jgi:hypothetical protein